MPSPFQKFLLTLCCISWRSQASLIFRSVDIPFVIFTKLNQNCYFYKIESKLLFLQNWIIHGGFIKEHQCDIQSELGVLHFFLKLLSISLQFKFETCDIYQLYCFNFCWNSYQSAFNLSYLWNMWLWYISTVLFLGQAIQLDPIES